MWLTLKHLYWRIKYRPGRVLIFDHEIDSMTEVQIVENRIAVDGKIVYRERAVNVFGNEQDPFGPPMESTIPVLLERMRRVVKDQTP